MFERDEAPRINMCRIFARDGSRMWRRLEVNTYSVGRGSGLAMPLPLLESRYRVGRFDGFRSKRTILSKRGKNGKSD